MNEVKTYAVNCNDAWLNTDGDDISGSYVKYADYMALATKLDLAERACAALAAENAGMKSGAMDEIEVINRGGQAYCVKDGVQVNPMYARGWNDYRAKSMQSDTPATDAFLAEVRAQGVEMFADHLLCPDLDDTIRDFAAQLRKGGGKK